MVATRLAAAQVSIGHEVHLLSYKSPDAQLDIEAMFQQIPHGDKISRHLLPPLTQLSRIFTPGVNDICRKLIPDMDFIHIHSVWEPILACAAAAARNLGVPYAQVTHGMLDPWCLAQRAFKKKIALALRYRRMLAGADFLHVLNADEARLIEPLNLPCPKEVIPNGIFLEELDNLPPPGAFYQKLPQLQDKPYILFLSRLHYKKGLDYLADSFALLTKTDQEIQLVVVGPDGGAQIDFERQISAAGLSDRVHIVGPQFGSDKWAAMVDASCFCLPSRQEGFSIAITEALACGTPVVISEGCHFPEVAEVGAGKVVSLNAAKIAAALQEVLRNPEIQRSMGRAGREIVADRYTWPKIAQRTDEAYERALRRRSGVG